MAEFRKSNSEFREGEAHALPFHFISLCRTVRLERPHTVEHATHISRAVSSLRTGAVAQHKVYDQSRDRRLASFLPFKEHFSFCIQLPALALSSARSDPTI